MARRNRRQRANDRRRKMKTYGSEPELGSDEQSELSGEDSYPHSDTQIEIKVESPISNANAQHVIDHRGNVKNLYKAVLRGDWKAANTALSLDSNIARIELTDRGDNALHVAVVAKQTAFVHKLVERLNPSELERRNRRGNTAFYIAAELGVVEIAKVMYKKNKNLPSIPSSIGKTPLEMAIVLGKRKMVEYLYPITPLEYLDAEKNMEILEALIHMALYDIALKILNGSSISTKNVVRALLALTRKPLQVHGFRGHWMWERLVRTNAYISHFRRIYSTLQMMSPARQLVKVLWDHIMTLPDSNIKLIRLIQILQDAAKLGNVEFLTLINDSYPDLFWEVSEEYHFIFHVAVINRQDEVFNLIYQIGVVKDLIALYRDENGNNILHLAGKLAPPSRLKMVPGAALKMHRELRWFKEVEKIVPSSFHHMKNYEGLTPMELFSKEHEVLRQDGEKWMKEIASFCLVVGTLIAAVAFSASITLPGGSNQESGTANLLKDSRFKAFVVSNVVAMFSSTTSIMIFLSFLTLPYVEDDFLVSLPIKLMIGLISIYVSSCYMFLTFIGATFFSIYYEKEKGLSKLLLVGLFLLAVIIYPILNHKLLNAMIFLTGWLATLTFQPDGHRLYS